MDKPTLTGAGDRPPILDQIFRKLPQRADREECIARKHNCTSVWCPSCYRRFHLAKHYARLSEMPWQESRLVTLTFDREVTGEGADAYLFSRENKVIGRFIQNLERLGVEIKDWAGQIEWHGDGTPHWHLLVWTQKGKVGMIGQDRIHQAWPWGRIVHEEYFKNKKHYNRLVGYFGKAGYFHKGKKHQVILPDYFKTDYFRGKRIARFYSARRPGERLEPSTREEKEPRASETITGRKLTTCGQMTLLYYRPKYDWTGVFPSPDLILFDELSIPYKDFISQCPGEYVKGLGYNFHLSGAPPVPCPF